MILLELQANTFNQASVYFNYTILFSVISTDDDMVKRAVYSLASSREFELSAQCLLENETLTYVATKRQAEMIRIFQNVNAKIEQ